ncbi:MAG: MSHA biogenesis protein MshJ [Burkholderiaceae bacterium]|nr:MSHA biogenesis protein MshJ [Burkholderiaceae bacterium]
MKQQWEKLAGKINALSLRERGILFALCTLGLVLVANTYLIEPQFLKHKALADSLARERMQIASLQAEITRRAAGIAVDPDADLKKRLADSQREIDEFNRGLTDLKKNLVPPEKMANLLEQILKRNRRLQLVSLKTLPAVDLLDQTKTSGKDAGKDGAKDSTAAKTAAVTAAVANAVNKTAEKLANLLNADSKSEGGIYQHEVEIVLEGNYLDMLSTMQELEALPEQVYWRSAKLTVIEYPKASLNMHMFTLSLDKKWLNL